MGAGYLNDITIMLPYMQGVKQFSNGVVIDPLVPVEVPSFVCIDKNNAKWVANNYDHSIVKIVAGVAVLTIPNEMDYGIAGMCVDKNNTVWYIDQGNWSVFPIVNGVKGAAVSTIGLGNSNAPTGICSDKDGALWIVKPDQMDVSKVLKIVNNVVTAIYDLEWGPRGICCDRNNVIYVANYESSTITKIANDIGTTIAVTDFPAQLCVDKDNALWVLHVGYEDGVGKVSKIVNGTVTQVITAGIGSYPDGICCDNENSIWVATPQDYNLVKIVGSAVVLTKEMPDYFSILGDATGMQAAILFEGGEVTPPSIVAIMQAMSGGM